MGGKQTEDWTVNVLCGKSFLDNESLFVKFIVGSLPFLFLNVKSAQKKHYLIDRLAGYLECNLEVM